MNQRQDISKADGYRGIWYSNQPTGDEYRYKYSGGLGTYPQQLNPLAVHAPAARKTFFCWGGASADRKGGLLEMVSYFDHATGTVPRPTILAVKGTDDAHDNPTISLDDDGHLWVFCNSHGRSRDSFILRSVEPYSIDAFDRVAETNFSYSQPWHLSGQGFLFLHTRYHAARSRVLHWSASRDGLTWSEARILSNFAQGHYQVSAAAGGRVGTAFNYHPDPDGLNARTNLYYLQTLDFGATWQTAGGVTVQTPLTEPHNPALVRDYQAEGLLAYLKDVAFDAEGRPVVLYLTSRTWAPGPQGGLRQWWTARWTGAAWEYLPFTTSDHNYDYGPLYIEPDGAWRVIAPTAPGPQPWGTGGEIVLWLSRDRGRS